MVKQKSRLGRGLDALIPSTEARLSPGGVDTGVTEIPVSRISPNPHQPRQRTDDESLAELADSIRTHGLLQPLVVTRVGEVYQIIAGERRWRAAQLAELGSIPVLIKETTPQQMLELALVENIQRADLNSLEEAYAYQQLMDEFGLTQEEVARQVGKSRTAVANTVRLLKLPDELKAALMEEIISEGHARALLALSTPEAQGQVLKAILEQGLNVRQTEALVRHKQTEPVQSSPPASPPSLSPIDHDVVEQFQKRLGTRVNLVRGKKGGRLIIHFYSDEELHAIYQAVVEDEEA